MKPGCVCVRPFGKSVVLVVDEGGEVLVVIVEVVVEGATVVVVLGTVDARVGSALPPLHEAATTARATARLRMGRV